MEPSQEHRLLASLASGDRQAADRLVDETYQMVYASLEPRDKRIFEMKTGYAGKQMLDNMTIAKRLGVSPAFVSQRGAWLTRQLLETMARV